jgi:hypothetical protein
MNSKSISKLADDIAIQYSRLSQVESMTMGGSQVTKSSDRESDIDMYVYTSNQLPLTARKSIVEKYATRFELNNQFWEDGDEWIDEESGIHIDVMFRSLQWMEDQLDRVLIRYEASVGYSTCIWYNVLNSKILFDQNGWFTNLQKKSQQPYPEELRQAIIAKNYPILQKNLSSYIYQLENAVKRNDRISINHRITALLASYFDIIFAVNRLPHPGEKRILQFAEANCTLLPENMGAQVAHLLDSLTMGDVIKNALELIDSLDVLLASQGLTTAGETGDVPTDNI